MNKFQEVQQHLSEQRYHWLVTGAAGLSNAATMLGYGPTHRTHDGLKEAMDWNVRDFAGQERAAVEPIKS